MVLDVGKAVDARIIDDDPVKAALEVFNPVGIVIVAIVKAVRIRAAVSNSFGFGGLNAVLAVTEPR